MPGNRGGSSSEYHQLGSNAALFKCCQHSCSSKHIRARCLRYSDGERRLTNLLHLAELLHRLCRESRLGMSGLLKRLKRGNPKADAAHRDEYELRLEQDARAGAGRHGA